MDKTHGGNIWKVASDSGIRPGDIIDFSASINPLIAYPDGVIAVDARIML